MSVFGGVFDSLSAMSLLQLLLAFIACIGYALAQGRLVGSRGRQIASVLAALGGAGFALESTEWMDAAMQLAFAVAGMGVFVAMVWLTSRVLGFARTRMQPPEDVPQAGAAATQPGAAPVRSTRPGEHAHSI